MTQVSKHPVRKEVLDEIFEMFLQTIAQLRKKGEVSSFFNEFLTPNERIMFTKRLAVGILIAEGYKYKEIKYLLKISTSTISTFSSFYKYGEKYRKVINKVKINKEIKQFLLKLGEVISAAGSVGKGSDVWRNVNKQIKSSKSKLLR
jgi:uncharacterized protein YerC